MSKLTKQQAIEAMKEGKKVTHRYFENHEWVKQVGFTMIMEDGASIDSDTFWKDRNGSAWETDWSLFDAAPVPLGEGKEDDLGALMKEVEKYAGRYEFSFQFWGEADNNVFLYKNDVELFSSGGHDNAAEVIKAALEYIYKINRTPKEQRVF